ncbi:MAG: MOP flippase family protein [Planctomycetota bacterium]|jgi:PST family polysaccharide transporter
MHNLDKERSEGLKQTAVSGFKWTALAHGVRLTVHFLTTAVLAWLLLPEDFGLVGMAAIVVGFVHLFRDFGTAAAVVQRPDLDHGALSTLLWTNLVAGAGLTGLIVLCAPAAAVLFAEPRLVLILEVLALGVFLASIGVVPASLLQRQLRFAALARVEIAALVAGGATGLAVALLGGGVWALVAQTLVVTGVHALLVLPVAGFAPAMVFRLRHLHGVAGYSLNLAGFNVVNWCIRNLDHLLIGVFLGATALGYYALAYRLLLYPLQAVSTVLSRVVFPIYARIQDDDARLRNAHLKITAAVAMVMFPVMAGLMLVCQPMVVSLLGPKWLPTVPLIAIFALVGMLQCVGATVGPIYQAKGRTDLLFRWGLLVAVVMAVAFAVGLQWEIRGVALAYAIGSIALTYPALRIPFRLIGLRVSQLSRFLFPQLLATAVMAACTLLVRYLVADSLPPAWHLVVVVVTGVVVYAAASLLWNRHRVLEIRDLLRGGV